MKTQIVTVTEEQLTEKDEWLRRAGEIIKNGGLVAFPTETVYGLGGDGLNKESSKKIYAAKGRPSDNPLIIHIADINDLDFLVKEVTPQARRIADKFWPGPLTMILPKSDYVPEETTGGLDTVAVRMPSHKVAHKLIAYAGGYVAAPSANVSGKPSPTVAKYVIEDMDGRIDMIIDGGEVGIGLESTIVDLTVDPPQILRPGFVNEEMLKQVLGSVEMDKAILSGDNELVPKAPGMKYRHYAPKGQLTVVTGDADEVSVYINAHAAEGMKNGKKVGIICAEDQKDRYQADIIKSVGCREDEQAIAHNLYRILREFDDENAEVIYSEAFDQGHMGQAIMNRLLKAAGYHVITV